MLSNVEENRKTVQGTKKFINDDTITSFITYYSYVKQIIKAFPVLEAEVSGGPAVLSIASGTAGEVVRHLRQELHFHIQLQLRARVRPVRYRCPPQPEGDGIHRRGRDTADVIRRRLPRLRRSRSPSTNSRKQPRASQTFVRW